MSAKQIEQNQAIEVGNECLCFNLRRASRLVSQVFDQALKPTGLKVTQFSVLMGVKAMPKARLGQLARVLGLERTSLTRNLDLLSSRGLVAMQSGKDKREQLASLTPKGVAALETALPHWRKVQDKMIDLLGSEAMDSFIGQLRGLSAELSPKK